MRPPVRHYRPGHRMKLPHVVFPPLALSSDDAAALEGVAGRIVQDMVAQFQVHAAVDGVVDERRWKKLRQQEQITVYKERSASDSISSVDGGGKKAVTPALLASGTIQADLEDVMYGTVNHTTDELRIHTVYTEGGFMDMATLASIIKPTAMDPFRSLTVKWVLKENPGFIPASLVRLRDTLFLESTGIVTTKEGERIGYKLFHSVQIPGIRELTEFKIVRANISFCYLYQQVAPKVVSVFMKSIMNVFGSVPASMTALNASESLVTTWKFTVHCAEMKKLMWLVRSAKSEDVRPRAATASTCGVCQRALKAGSGAICCACHECTCSRCCVRKALSFILPHKPNEASPLKLVFCTHCLLRAAQASSFDVAVQDALDGAAAVRLPEETLLRQTSLSCSSSSRSR